MRFATLGIAFVLWLVRAPLGSLRRAQRYVHHLFDLRRRQRLAALGTSGILWEAIHIRGHITPAPVANREYTPRSFAALPQFVNPLSATEH